MYKKMTCIVRLALQCSQRCRSPPKRSPFAPGAVYVGSKATQLGVQQFVYVDGQKAPVFKPPPTRALPINTGFVLGGGSATTSSVLLGGNSRRLP